jgi:hypothetical protein
MNEGSLEDWTSDLHAKSETQCFYLIWDIQIAHQEFEPMNEIGLCVQRWEAHGLTEWG